MQIVEGYEFLMFILQGITLHTEVPTTSPNHAFPEDDLDLKGQYVC